MTGMWPNGEYRVLAGLSCVDGQQGRLCDLSLKTTRYWDCADQVDQADISVDPYITTRFHHDTIVVLSNMSVIHNFSDG